MVPAFPVPGTFDWLASVFKTHQKWKEIDHKTQRFYEQGLALFANHKLKDGSRAGSKQITDFTKGFVDAIYAKLLVVEDEAGSCPPAWCSWRWGTAFAGQSRVGQLAIAGRLTVVSSLNGAMVSSVM